MRSSNLVSMKGRRLPRGAPIYRADDIIHYVYFPHTGIVSFIVGVESGQYVEAGMLGRNGVVGAGALWTVSTPSTRPRSKGRARGR